MVVTGDLTEVKHLLETKGNNNTSWPRVSQPPNSLELDLDAFRNSPLTSDDDEDNKNPNSVPHRTIDKILNASDYYTSYSPPTSL